MINIIQRENTQFECRHLKEISESAQCMYVAVNTYVRLKPCMVRLKDIHLLDTGARVYTEVSVCLHKAMTTYEMNRLMKWEN